MFARRLRTSPRIHRQYTFQLGSSQRRWARVEDVGFLVRHHQTDRVIEKYRDKLQRRARDEGLQSVDELKTVYKARIQEQRSSAAYSVPPPPPAPEPGSPASPSSTKPSLIPPGLKTLSSYLDLERTRALPPKEIEYIWRLRHAASPTSLCAILPSTTYTRIVRTARQHPQFILPLPREGSGAEIHLLQWSFPAPHTATIIFTHLAEYKVRGELSTPHTALTMHTELEQDKGLVLMQGQVMEGRGVKVDEAQLLLLNLQKFYSLDGGEGDSRRRLLEMFSQGDEAFRIEALLEEAEKIV